MAKGKLITEDRPSSGSWEDASPKKKELKEAETKPDRVVPPVEEKAEPKK